MTGLHEVMQAIFTVSADMGLNDFDNLFPNRANDYPVFKASPIIFYHYLNDSEAFKFRQMIIDKVQGVE